LKGKQYPVTALGTCPRVSWLQRFSWRCFLFSH